MRKIGNTNFAAVIASFENGDARGPFDPRWDVVANPPAPDHTNPGPALGSADVNHSSLLFDLQSGSSPVDSATGSDQSSTHQGSIADWIATDFRPFASSLVPFDADASGRDTSNHSPLDDSESVNDSDINVTAQNDSAQVIHTSVGNASDTPDAMVVATNAASNQNSTFLLNSHFGDFDGGQPDHGNAINSVAVQTPIFTNTPARSSHPDCDALAL